MPRPMLRTRSKKRKYCTLPGGLRKVAYKKEKIGNQKCSNCGRDIMILPRSAKKIRKLPKSQKTITRPYSGQLCHLCLRSLLKQASRAS